jgi:DNA invertase Pin-like site-specific DNA recombinase
MTPKPEVTTLVWYGRISPRPAHALGDPCSLSVQLEACMRYARMRGLEIVARYQDELRSGASVDGRPAFAEAMALATSKGHGLIVYSLSRFARSTMDALSLSQKLNAAGCDLVSVSENIDTTSPQGRLFFTIMASFAQFEREVGSQRTSETMLAYMQQGRRMGGKVPYGLMVDPSDSDRMAPCPEEQEQVAEVETLHMEGKCPAEIARCMAAAGRMIRGHVWRKNMVSLVLRRKGLLARKQPKPPT